MASYRRIEKKNFRSIKREKT